MLCIHMPISRHDLAEAFPGQWFYETLQTMNKYDASLPTQKYRLGDFSI